MSDSTSPEKETAILGETEDGHAFIVSSERLGISDSEKHESLTDMVEQPAKVMRIGRMITRLLDEIKPTELDDASRTRLSEIYTAAITELSDGLNPELADELQRITCSFPEETPPSEYELRIAHAQLVGWLEGLFQGIQTALVAHQVANQSKQEHSRRSLENSDSEGHSSRGMYL